MSFNLAPPDLISDSATGQTDGGYVEESLVTYMVMDDLAVEPLSSTASIISRLDKFNVKNMGTLEEKVVELGMDEVCHPYSLAVWAWLLFTSFITVCYFIFKIFAKVNFKIKKKKKTHNIPWSLVELEHRKWNKEFVFRFLKPFPFELHLSHRRN